MGPRPALSIHNKLMPYKQLLQPVWTSGIQLLGCAEQSNTDIVQRFQNKVLRNSVDAPRYIRNADIHSDLQMEIVRNEPGTFATKHEGRLLQHVNVEAIQLMDKSETVQRLKRKKKLSWCSDH